MTNVQYIIPFRDRGWDVYRDWETKNKMGKARVGKPLSEEIKNKMSETRKGKKASDITKAKLSIIAKNKFSFSYIVTGKRNYL